LQLVVWGNAFPGKTPTEDQAAMVIGGGGSGCGRLKLGFAHEISLDREKVID
jgi:hypothetical protein